MMISLLYVSTATHLLSNEELLEILHVSRRNNETGAITGMLLYKDGNFMQVLEGPEESVREIFGEILKDSRHTDITANSCQMISHSINTAKVLNWLISCCHHSKRI